MTVGDLPDEGRLDIMDLEHLARHQHGVVTREQALLHMSRSAYRWKVASGRWRQLHPGILQLSTTQPTWLARASAALLHAGEGAALAGTSAAYLWKLRSKEPPVIMVAVPHARRLRRMPGVRIVRRRTLVTAIRQKLSVTDAASTVVDLGTSPGATEFECIAVMADAVRTSVASVDDLAAEIRRRKHHRHRASALLALGIVARGAESGLEVDFVEGVLERHGLPRLALQVLGHGAGGSTLRRDFEDLPSGVVVEVDGVLGHEGSGALRDRVRDRRSAAQGKVTLRVGWVDVRSAPCEIAADLWATMASRGRVVAAEPCGPSCALGNRLIAVG